MSSKETNTGSIERPTNQQVLSHLVQRLLQREGGRIPLERVTLRVSNFADLGEHDVADLIDEGAESGIYMLDRGPGGSTTITGVSPQGSEPEVLVEAFGRARADDTAADFRVVSVVTDSSNEALREAGYSTFGEFAAASVGDLTGLTGPLTESRAAAIIQEAPQHVPVGTRLATAAAHRYARRLRVRVRCPGRKMRLETPNRPSSSRGPSRARRPTRAPMLTLPMGSRWQRRSDETASAS
ncbi:MAG: hypothetical protein V5A62_04850 [Haloarculaceae archaeon]